MGQLECRNVNKCVAGKCWYGVRHKLSCVCGFFLRLLRVCWDFSGPYSVFISVFIHVADGVSECSATLDDSVSEEEEEGSFDELTDVTPYLQPGVELSVLSEVRLREGILSRCNTCKDLFQKCASSFWRRAYLATLLAHKQLSTNVNVPISKMSGLSSAEHTTSAWSTSLYIILHVRHGFGLHVIVCLSYLFVCCSVDKLWPRSLCWGSLGPCDHGGAGAGLQGWRCNPCLGGLT